MDPRYLSARLSTLLSWTISRRRLAIFNLNASSRFLIVWNVHAHHIVAYECFAEAIDHELVRGAERGALQMLHTSLGINDPDGLHICHCHWSGACAGESTYRG